MDNPAGIILEVSLSVAVPRCLHILAEIGVADLLDDSPRTAADLAQATGSHRDALNRALRLVSTCGIFEECPEGYKHTPASRLLRSDHPHSMRSFVRMVGLPIVWDSFGALTHSMQTGEPAAKQVEPGGFWAHMAKHPDESRIFAEAMTGRAHAQTPRIVSSYDFSSFQTIADIGGGRGHLLEAVLNAAPNASGVLFDLPQVLAGGAQAASARMRLHPGDFFKDSIPVCDAYLLMQVIHNWSDEQAGQILSAIRRAAPAQAKLLMIEGIVPEGPIPALIKLSDIFMLALLNGKERTRREFEELLVSSGFTLERVINVGLGTSILEASISA